MRDSQRAKVYSAERRLWSKERDSPEEQKMSLTDATNFCYEVIESAWTRHRFSKANSFGLGRDVRPLKIKGNLVRVWARSGGVLSLPGWARYKLMILHELAHLLVGVDKEHNCPFTTCLVALVGHFIGQDIAVKLSNAFRSEGVKYRMRLD